MSKHAFRKCTVTQPVTPTTATPATTIKSSELLYVCMYACVHWQRVMLWVISGLWKVLAPSSPHHPEPRRPATRPHTTTPGLVKREEILHPPPEARGVPSCLATRLLFGPKAKQSRTKGALSRALASNIRVGGHGGFDGIFVHQKYISSIQIDILYIQPQSSPVGRARR